MSHRPDSSEYSEEYFLTECNGYAQYKHGQGTLLAPRLRAVWEFAHLTPGIRVLDIGCGRGEIIAHCGTNGIFATGIDFSAPALHLAQRTITQTEQQGSSETWQRPRLVLADAKNLPFPDNTFDRVIMSDVVEHLYPSDLATALHEVYRVLIPRGQLLIHTMPNLWYYRYGYPLFRLVQRLRGVLLPRDPRQRFRFSHVHVNEQNPLTLRRVLSKSPFSRWQIWLYDYRDYSEYGTIMRLSMRLLTRSPVLRNIFCDDIFARAYK